MDAIAIIGLLWAGVLVGALALSLATSLAMAARRLLDATTARAVAETRRAEAETAALRAQEERVLLEMETYDDDE